MLHSRRLSGINSAVGDRKRVRRLLENIHRSLSQVTASRRLALNILRFSPGRVLTVLPDGTLYLGRHNNVYASDDDGATWTRVLCLPRSPLQRMAEGSRLACRLVRHEVRALIRLSGGGFVAATRTGVYCSEPGCESMKLSRMDGCGLRVHPPMCLTTGPNDEVLWGEYWGNKERREVRLFASLDQGRTFDVIHTFARREVKHIHNLVLDERRAHYWVLAGDHDSEPGIGRLSLDLRSFDWFVKGKQACRAVCLLDMGDCLVYGTDSEKEPNAIVRLEKSTGRLERLAETEGSCIYACRFGRYYVLSTSVEPSDVNHCQDAGLWVSSDGDRWTRVYQARKDRWDASLFQFGSIVLPRGSSNRETLSFSGQALCGIDGQALVATLTEHPAGE